MASAGAGASAGPSANQRDTFHKRVNTSDGHYVRWDIVARDLRLMHDWDFEKHYKTCCPTTESSWHFKMTYPDIGDDGTTTLCIHVKRLDDAEKNLDATVWVDIMDELEQYIYPRQSFTEEGMPAGTDMHRITDLEPYPFMADAVKSGMIIRVTFMISACHGNQ